MEEQTPFWAGTPRVTPKGGGGGGGKNSRFFFPFPPPFRSFCVSLGVFSWNFGGLWSAGFVSWGVTTTTTTTKIGQNTKTLVKTTLAKVGQKIGQSRFGQSRPSPSKLIMLPLESHRGSSMEFSSSTARIRNGRKTGGRSRKTGRREHSRTSAHANDHGWNEDTQTRFEPIGHMNTCASADGARRAQNCAVFASVCIVVFMQLVTMRSRLFMLCVKMYAVFRSLCVPWIVREYQVQDVFHLHFCCLTSKFVWAVLDIAMYFSGIGNNSSLNE